MNSQEYYELNGYFVFKGLISDILVDKFLNLYKKDIFTSKNKFFRQSTDEYESYKTNEIKEFGLIKKPFLDIHDYQKYPDFSNIASKYIVAMKFKMP